LGGGEKSRWCVWKSQPGPSQWPPPSCSSMASMPGVLETSWKANSERVAWWRMFTIRVRVTPS